MRTAIVSDIHGNRTAFDAVLKDLRQTAPDLILHGGDLCDGGSSPTEIVDQIRDLGWQGVVGNTDEMLFRPQSLEEFARDRPALARARPGSKRRRLDFGIRAAQLTIAIYGHIHRSYIRSMPGITVANTGSVSLSYDGDRRAAYLLLDGSEPTIRRVEYEVDREIAELSRRGFPHADWIAKILMSAGPQMP